MISQARVHHATSTRRVQIYLTACTVAPPIVGDRRADWPEEKLGWVFLQHGMEPVPAVCNRELILWILSAWVFELLEEFNKDHALFGEKRGRYVPEDRPRRHSPSPRSGPTIEEVFKRFVVSLSGPKSYQSSKACPYPCDSLATSSYEDSEPTPCHIQENQVFS